MVDMVNLVIGLLICLTAVQALQHAGNRTRTKTKTKNQNSTVVEPKTFKGRTEEQNHTYQLLDPSTDYELKVNPGDPVETFTKGIFSTRVIPLSYILAMLVGIPSNAYILAFLRLRAKSFTTIVLYLNLALSDLLLLLSQALRVHYHFNRNNWIFGEISCRLITALFYGNIYCSAQTIACISLRRYLAVVRPFLYRRLAKTSLAAWTCFVIWFLFVAAIVPELMVRQSYYITQLGITTCHDVLPLDESSHSLLMSYRLTLVFTGFIVPFLICLFAHAAVVYHLGQSHCDWKPFIKVSTLVFVIFAICFLPSGILHIAHYICLLLKGDDRLYGYYRVAVCLCSLHSCLDPFLCMLISKMAASDLQFMSLPRTPQRRL